ncbi:MAG: penicillin-binding protein activator [Pseudomonadota bacterium]
MSLRSTSRFGATLPILFFSALLVVAGCATQPAGPVGPISTGNPRVDPDQDGNGVVDLEDAGDEEQDMEPGEIDESGPYTPPHMAGRELVRAGVMLPFSHPRESVRNQAEGMLAAIELAMFDHAGENFVLLPRDTRGATGTTEELAETLQDQGADFVLGPLFAANVTAARDTINKPDFFGFSPEASVPIVAFSNDRTAAGGGAWLASMMPEEEVREVTAYARAQGYDTFAFFGPQSSLGLRVEAAMRQEVMSTGALMLTSGFYSPNAESPAVEAASFAAVVESAVLAGNRVAVLVPERGNRLRGIAPLLAYHGVDTRRVKMLGLSNWNDPAIWREPSLAAAWFPAPPVNQLDNFDARYVRQYGREPSSLGAVAYDAAALSIALAGDGELSSEELTNPDGFLGVNGLFRFREDGTAQRSLAIMEIAPSTEIGVREVRPVASSFLPSVG